MFIALSGIDGCGKSTQVTAVENYGATNSYSVKHIWSRGGYTSGFSRAKKFARALLGPRMPAPGPSVRRDMILSHSPTQRIWLKMAMVDLFRVYCFQLRQWQLQYDFVLCDRYLWDAQIDFEVLFPGIQFHSWTLWQALCACAPKPECAFLLWLPVNESVRRCEAKQEPFPDPFDVKLDRYAKYRELAAKGSLTVIDAQLPLADVTAIILGTIHSQQLSAQAKYR